MEKVYPSCANVCMCLTCPLKLWWNFFHMLGGYSAIVASLTEISLLNSSSSKFICQLLLWAMQAMSPRFIFSYLQKDHKIKRFFMFFFSFWEEKLLTQIKSKVFIEEKVMMKVLKIKKARFLKRIKIQIFCSLLKDVIFPT